MKKIILLMAVMIMLVSGCKRGESLMYPDPSITVTSLNLPPGK